MKDIRRLGLGCGLPAFIGGGFLVGRTMRVCVGSSLSGCCGRERGVPQGGVLSTTLFGVGVGDIVKCLGNLSGCSLCVGGFCVCCRLEGMGRI